MNHTRAQRNTLYHMYDASTAACCVRVLTCDDGTSVETTVCLICSERRVSPGCCSTAVSASIAALGYLWSYQY